MLNEKMSYLLEMVKNETKPAIGCTEPVAVAFAAAFAKQYIEGPIDKINVIVSKSIFKNGKSVIIPNTEEHGLDLAATLGIVGGDYKDGLLVLKNVNKDNIHIAHKLIAEGKVIVDYLDNSPDIYVDITLESQEIKVRVVLKDSHDHIDYVKINDELVYEDKNYFRGKLSNEVLSKTTFIEIREIIEKIPAENLFFLEEGVIMNKKAAELGLDNLKGLGIGHALNRMQQDGKLFADSSTRARILTAASADARMGGVDCPIMTSAGSGNQGLGVVLPILVVAEDNNIEKEKLLRALFFAHIVNKFIKTYTGKLSAMCGCAIAAGVGSSVGITWMLGGDDEQISGAASNMLSNLTGMICDGAKETCSFKLSTSAGESVLSAYLAMENIIVKPKIGIIGDSIEDTIKNLGVLCKDGLSDTDNVIVDIIK